MTTPNHEPRIKRAGYLAAETAGERLIKHRRKSVASAIRDERLADDLLDLMRVTGTYTMTEWHAVLHRLEHDHTRVADIITNGDLI